MPDPLPVLRAAEGERRAVVLVGSQKTLPIAVTVLGQLAAYCPARWALRSSPVLCRT